MFLSLKANHKTPTKNNFVQIAGMTSGHNIVMVNVTKKDQIAKTL